MGVGGLGREEAVFNGGMVQILTTSFFRPFLLGRNMCGRGMKFLRQFQAVQE